MFLNIITRSWFVQNSETSFRKGTWHAENGYLNCFRPIYFSKTAKKACCRKGRFTRSVYACNNKPCSENRKLRTDMSTAGRMRIWLTSTSRGSKVGRTPALAFEAGCACDRFGKKQKDVLHGLISTSRFWSFRAINLYSGEARTAAAYRHICIFPGLREVVVHNCISFRRLSLRLQTLSQP